MIGYIKGELAETKANSLVVENQGIGYEITVPHSIFQKLPAIGASIKLYTYLQVKEDGLALFGFLRRDDLDIFKLMITVNGIGPKGAIGILSFLTADDLRFAVLAEDTKAIAKAPGIGIKTAGKLILELKDKFKLSDAFESKLNQTDEIPDSQGSKIRNEAIQALVALGYAAADAMRAVKLVNLTDMMTVEELLKLSLKKMR